MVETSLLTERDPFPIPLYLGDDRVKIVRYLYLKDLEKELTPSRYKTIKNLIKEKKLHYLYHKRGDLTIRYRAINF